MDKIYLGNECVPYILIKRKRKSIGLKINNEGLTVSAPINEPFHTIESLLKKQTAWILSNLRKWKQKKSTQPIWSLDSCYPLLGHPWCLAIQDSGALIMIPENTQTQNKNILQAKSLTPQHIEHYVMNWYFNQALPYFNERIAYYRPKLNVSQPKLKLSRAKTRWGSCNSQGVIHLNWRLIQLPPELVDYVIAHELAHLIEMNHSPAFWKQVEQIYPAFHTARKKLKEYG